MFCEFLREQAMEITNFKKKIIWTVKIIWKAKICYICKEKFEDKHVKYKKYHKVRNHYQYTWEYRGTTHSICNLKYNVPKEISIVFHNRSNYDYHFIIKELPKNLKLNLFV